MQPLSSPGYDISLSGQSLSDVLMLKMESLFAETHGFSLALPENQETFVSKLKPMPEQKIISVLFIWQACQKQVLPPCLALD